MKNLLKELGQHKILTRLTIIGFILLIFNLIIINYPSKVETNNQPIVPTTASFSSTVKTIQIK